jgi:hypothetical protein
MGRCTGPAITGVAVRRSFSDTIVRMRAGAATILCGMAALGLAGCFDVQAADLFQMTRQGPGGRLTFVVNDGGTIRCNGAKARSISNSNLITARDLADDLDTDARAHLHLPVPAGTVTTYSVSLQDGSISFADRNASAKPELARAVLFALQMAQGPCKGSA